MADNYIQERIDNLFKSSIVTEKLGLEYKHIDTHSECLFSNNYTESLVKVIQYLTGEESYLEIYRTLVENSKLDRDIFCLWDNKLVNKYLMDLHEHVKVPTRHIHLDNYITFIQLISILSKFTNNSFIITITINSGGNFYIMYEDGKVVDIDLLKFNINILYTLPVSDIIILNNIDDKDVEYIRNETSKFTSILHLFDIDIYNINDPDNDNSLTIEDEIICIIAYLANYSYKKAYEELLQISLEIAEGGNPITGIANNLATIGFISHNTEMDNYKHLCVADRSSYKFISCLEFMIRNRKGKFLITSNNSATLFIYDNGALKYPFNNTNTNLLSFIDFVNKLAIEPIWELYYTDVDEKDIYFF